MLNKDRTEDGFIIRPNAIVKNENEAYFVDCIRRDDGWKEEFADRLSRYNKVINDYDSLNYKFSKNQNLSLLQRIQNIVMKQKSLPTLILI